MRIVIDLQACQSDSRFRGIGRYSSALTKALVRQAGDHEIWIALNDRFPETIPGIRAEFDGLVSRERIVTFSIPGPVTEINRQNAWRTRTAELLREYFLTGLNPDIVHISSIFEGWYQDVVGSIDAYDQNTAVSVTLYDLIPLVLSDKYFPNSNLKDYYFRKLESLKKAECLLAISEYTRQDAIKLLGLSPDSIINISSAVDDTFKPRKIMLEENSIIQERYHFNKPFILYSPGGFDERKNIHNLITAYSHLPPDLRATYQLVITSKITDGDAENILLHARKQGLGAEELILPGYVPNEDLITLYNLCKLFIFPSLYEGFGLPALEAMACGAVVIASNTTSLPEIIGRTDALFNPAHPEEITRLMQHALTDEGFRQSLREHGFEQAKKYSWDESAKRAMEVFEVLHKRNQNEIKAQVPLDHDVEYNNLVSSLAKIKATVPPTQFDLLATAKSIAVNNPPPGSRQLCVDISELVLRDAKSGIQRVVRSILLELLKSPPSGYRVEPVYFDGQCYRYAHHFVNNFLGIATVDLEDDVVGLARGDIYLGLDLSANIIFNIHDYLKQLNILGVEINFVVYDILPVLHPEWWPEGMEKIMRQWLESIAEVATGLICISRSVADEVKEWLTANPTHRVESLPIGYFHLGADIENSVPTTGIPEEASDVLKALASSPSFLMVGTVEPRKGHAQVLSAFELLWKEGHNVNLVVIGKRGWLVENLIERLSTHSILGKHLFWLEGISDEYLERIYELSSAVIMASEGEGFGLPIIEAARHKIPLILRGLPVFREVAGEHATYFTGLEPDALSTAIVDWLEQDRQKKTPSSKDIRFLTWSDSAQSLINLLQNPQDANWVSIWNGERSYHKK